MSDSKSSSPTTMCEAFQRCAAIAPDAVALRTPGDTQTLTWREYAAEVRRAAAGLAGIGVRRGDTVSLMMANRIEFYPLEVGAQHLGATSFSVYNTLPAEQLTYLFDNAGTKVVICEEQYVDRIRASGATLEHIVCIDGAPEGTMSLDELYAAATDEFDFDATWRAVEADDVITLIYTSGTTGNPKGVEMTHTNLLFEADALGAVLGCSIGRSHHVVSAVGSHRRPHDGAVQPGDGTACRSRWCPMFARSRSRWPTPGQPCGPRFHECGKSSKPQSNSRLPTSRTR